MFLVMRQSNIKMFLPFSSFVISLQIYNMSVVSVSVTTDITQDVTFNHIYVKAPSDPVCCSLSVHERLNQYETTTSVLYFI